jgi:hypothetical protein
MTSRKIFANEAQRYWGGGHRIVPLEPGEKRPAKELRGWQGLVSAVPSDKTQTEWLQRYGDRGIGLLLGAEVAPGLKLAAVDVDDDAFVSFVQRFLGSPICAKRGKKGISFFVVVEEKDPMKSTAIHGADKKGVIDILFTGKMTVLPPSEHPDIGRPYEWVGRPLLDCDPADLPRFSKRDLELLKLVVGSPEARVLIAGETTHEAALTLSARLIAAGFDNEQ